MSRGPPSWKRAARAGALVGLAAVPIFFLLHAWIVTPIWSRWDAWARGLALAPAAGALLAVVLARLVARAEARFASAWGGALLGALAGATLAPFAIVGWMRARGAPDAFWLGILALLLASWWHATQAVQDARPLRARLELPAALLLANAFPAYFLTFIADFHDEAPNPFPFASAVAGLYLVCGVALSLWTRRAQVA